MVIQNIKKACEKHLSAISPSVPTAFEGVNFDPPNSLYQRCQFGLRSPDDPVFGTGYYREVFEFQVFVIFPKGKGALEGLNRAEMIREQFKKGTTLSEGGVDLHVLRTPRIAGTATTQDSMVIPVIIEMVAEVYTA